MKDRLSGNLDQEFESGDYNTSAEAKQKQVELARRAGRSPGVRKWKHDYEMTPEELAAKYGNSSAAAENIAAKPLVEPPSPAAPDVSGEIAAKPRTVDPIEPERTDDKNNPDRQTADQVLGIAGLGSPGGFGGL